MKNLKLMSLLIGAMLFIVSCETEPYQEDELEATSLKSSKDDGCETGFAICAGNITTCFIEDGFNRWGWTIGPLDTSEHLFAVYTGAGKCDVKKGELSAEVDLEYDSTTGIANVKFTALEGFVLKETHLYVGNDPYPTKKQGKREVPTVAPGKYPYKHDNLNGAKMDQYTIEGLSGEIYLIAHSIVCEAGE
ncbi:hypothetical protein [Ulvibacterium marinum]|nr:hypothetical protein [Ulvibacterium marinum]